MARARELLREAKRTLREQLIGEDPYESYTKSFRAVNHTLRESDRNVVLSSNAIYVGNVAASPLGAILLEREPSSSDHCAD